jgi:hypothetical protein
LLSLVVAAVVHMLAVALALVVLLLVHLLMPHQH